ncbi:MAG: hypothetical protein JKY27_11380 [Magnetovibrio sp.]|nr:hypothetical protein [Magnetovibrio sp.]
MMPLNVTFWFPVLVVFAVYSITPGTGHAAQGVAQLPTPASLEGEIHNYQQSTVRGQLRPRQHAVLAAGMQGELIAVRVYVGDRVTKDNVLASFNCRTEEARKAISQARLKAAQITFDVNFELS